MIVSGVKGISLLDFGSCHAGMHHESFSNINTGSEEKMNKILTADERLLKNLTRYVVNRLHFTIFRRR